MKSKFKKFVATTSIITIMAFPSFKPLHASQYNNLSNQSNNTSYKLNQGTNLKPIHTTNGWFIYYEYNDSKYVLKLPKDYDHNDYLGWVKSKDGRGIAIVTKKYTYGFVIERGNVYKSRIIHEKAVKSFKLSTLKVNGRTCYELLFNDKGIVRKGYLLLFYKGKDDPLSKSINRDIKKDQPILIHLYKQGN